MHVSTTLKVVVRWDHNGTYMDGFGFQYRNHQLTVEIAQDDQIAGEPLAPSAQLACRQLTTQNLYMREAFSAVVCIGLKCICQLEHSSAARPVQVGLLC